MDRLRRLEYRGYDSAWLAVLSLTAFGCAAAPGQPCNLAKSVTVE